MVVHNLQVYVEKEIPEAVQLSNLRELVNQELKCGRGRPTIVLDESALVKLIQQKRSFDIIWQPSILKKDVENFVENIISCGVNLIVVLRGKHVQVHEWYNKKCVAFMNKKKEFDMLFKDINKDVVTNNSVTPRLYLQNMLASITNNHYKVFRSLEYAHKEVAEIAISQNCLAVIGNDSNFLIYNGIRYYILTQTLNIKTLDCKIWSRNKVMEHLQLKSSHMPLFATLCGNDVIYSQNLQKFHSDILKSNNDKFVVIAKVIRGFTGDPYKYVECVLNLINNPKVGQGLIKKSIDMYLNFEKKLPKNKRLEFANERKKSCDWSVALYDIFIFKTFKHSRITATPLSVIPASTLMRSFRSKIYGVLLYDDVKDVSEYFLEEMDIQPGSKSFNPVKVVPLKPLCEHPGLIQLFDDNTPNVHYVRWNLFCSSISRTLKPSTLKSIPPKLLFPVLALHYLEVEVPSFYPEKIFKTFEIEAFLVAALLVHENIQLENIGLTKLDLRVTSLIIYFIETCCTLDLLNEACGLVVPKSQTYLWNFFDGILIHVVYEEMKEGAKWYDFFDDNVILEVTFSSLMDIIMN